MSKHTPGPWEYRPGYTYQAGDRISGTYCGTAFSGDVVNARKHTQRHDLTELQVLLDSEIEVYSMKRDRLLLMIFDSGEEYGNQKQRGSK